MPLQAARNEYAFDLGTPSSPVKQGWTQVTHETVYSRERGFGWERPAQGSFNDTEPVAPQFQGTHPNYVGPLDDPVLRDGVEDERPLAFLVDVPPGKYWVSVTLGRYRAFRHDMNFRLNGSIIATNIDAWGYVWGSQGGSPTKTIAALAEPTNGQLRLEFDYAHPGDDRWTEYSYRRPEAGKLWYLGPNKNSIVAIRVRPSVPAPVRLEKKHIVGRLNSAALQGVQSQFHNGDITNAIGVVTNFVPKDVNECIEKGALLDAMAGSMAIQEPRLEVTLLDHAIAAWQRVVTLLVAEGRQNSGGFWLAVARLESAQRYRQALEYLGMLGFKWADQKTGLNKYHRYWAAYDLCGPFTPDDPLYYKSHLLRGRVANWNGREGGWKNCYDLGKEHFAVLRASFPEDRLVRMYNGEQVPTLQRFEAPAAGAPEWARLQYEALHRYLHLIHYWVEHRQADNGELGGGWGDDVEILRGWLPAVLALDDPIARRGLQRLAEGVWSSGEITNGYSRNVDDVEHAAELMSDTQPLMCLVEYGDPVYLERCMATMRCMRDTWTAVNARGHRHFKSHYFSALTVNTNAPRAADVALNGRAANPGIPLLWYNRHPAVQRLIGEWCTAWIEDSFRTDGGKPRGFVPGSIRFEDDRLGGYAEGWWQTRDYFSDFESVGYTQTLYDSMLAMFATTGNPFYMSNLFATVDAVESTITKPPAASPPGSAAWAARVCDTSDVADVLAKWRQLSGQTNYDGFLKRRGSPYTRYLLSGDLNGLAEELRQIIKGLSANIEMSTSEVLFTDRVSLPGNEVLFEMMSGSVGTPTYFPLHAVTWADTSNQVAILVEHADTRILEVSLFNFAEKPLGITARPWRLSPGKYRLSCGALSNDVTLQERGERLKLNVPARQLVRLRLDQIDAFAPADPNLPDLALGSDAITILNPPLAVGKAARLRLTLHNLGLAAATETAGELRVGEQINASFTWPALGTPLNLEAQSVSIEAQWTPRVAGEHSLRLIADPNGKTKEAIKLNNQRTVEARVLQ